MTAARRFGRNSYSVSVWLRFWAFPVGAEKLHFSKVLDDREKQCLNQMIYASGWRDSPEFWSEMRRIAVVARAHLDGKRYVDYFFLFEADGWCGTGGCALLIAELKKGETAVGSFMTMQVSTTLIFSRGATTGTIGSTRLAKCGSTGGNISSSIPNVRPSISSVEPGEPKQCRLGLLPRPHPRRRFG